MLQLAPLCRVLLVVLVALCAQLAPCSAVSYEASIAQHRVVNATGHHFDAIALVGPSDSWFVYFGMDAQNPGDDDPLDGSEYVITLVGPDTNSFVIFINGTIERSEADHHSSLSFSGCACPGGEQNIGLWGWSLDFPEDVPSNTSNKPVTLTFSAVAGSLETNVEQKVPVIAPQVVIPFSITIATDAVLTISTLVNTAKLSEVYSEVHILDACAETPQVRPSWAFLSIFSAHAPNNASVNMTLPHLSTGTYQLLLVSPKTSSWSKQDDTIHVSLAVATKEPDSGGETGGKVFGIPPNIWYGAILVIALLAIISIASLVGYFFIRRRRDYEMVHD
eukprot:TRINITY_DN6758_c0_g1_i1.p1 TRINITY_DN6758_c0_g1~~TRINITY_DN6758_c0_g1_i1.p1  ORF type:complete len:356 (+),score=35.36 TRINITY_DN6758_c0_g1_i1:67-1068(+)